MSTTEWIDQDIENICAICEHAREYMDRELYLAEFGNLVDDKTILDRLYDILEEDLEDLGVVIVDDTFYQDWYLRRILISIRKVLDSEYLKKMITLHFDKGLKDLIFYITGNERTGEVFRSTITKLIEVVPLSDDLEKIESVFFQVSSTERLRDHLRSIIESIPDNASLLTKVNEKVLKEYIDVIEQGRHDFKEYMDLIFIKFKLDLERANKVIEEYDLDKVGNDIMIYAQVDKEDIHPSLVGLKKKYMDIHHERSKHHIEYYIKRKLVLDLESVVFLVGHHYKNGISIDDFTSDVMEMVDSNQDLFTITPREIVEKILEYLSKILGGK